MLLRFDLWLVGLCLIAGNAASQAPEEPLPPPLTEPKEADRMSQSPSDLMRRAETLLQKGNPGEALNLLLKCNEMSMQEHADRFMQLMNILMASNNLPGIETIYQANIAQSARLTRDYYHLLYQHYSRQGDRQALLDWTASLQAKTLPPDLRTQAFGWLLDASRTVGPVSRVTDLVPACVSNFDVSTSQSLLVGIISAYDCAGDHAAAHGVVDAIERATGRQPEWRRMVAVQRVKLLFSAAQWPQAETRFQKEAPILTDDELNGCFQYALACLKRANQLDLLDRLCARVLKEQKHKPRVWQAAADTWMQNARARQAIADIPRRLDALMRMGCASDMLVSFYFEYAELVMTGGKPDDTRAMLKLGERLFATVTDEAKKGYFTMLASESCFILADYEKALALLAKPCSSLNVDQQDIFINKIKAHLALQKGNKQEAIERFRGFMETVKTWPRPQELPYNNMLFTKEMCLGLNAKRIGDILSSMNDAQGAQAAYREAGGYYTVAQQAFKPGSQEGVYIKTHQDELAKLLKK